MRKDSRIYVAGSDTLVGRAICGQLTVSGYSTIAEDRDGVQDPADSSLTERFFSEFRPEFVFMAAGESGGIRANQRYPADLMIDNLRVITSVLAAAHRFGVKRLVYLASSCCYPRECTQPMAVDSLMSGPLEPTNQAYASAKLAGIALCLAYRHQYGAQFATAIPANPFGPGDDFDADNSHVVSALILKMHEARVHGAQSVTVWGTGSPEREFIYVDDLADACLFLMNHYDEATPINIGVPSFRASIKELAEMIREAVGYKGSIDFDSNHPDGMPRKILDSEPLRRLGWSAKTSFPAALRATYEHFLRSEQVNHA